MRLGPIDTPVPTLALVALAALVGVAFLVGGATGAAAFGPYNPDWEGLSELRNEADAAGLETVVATDVEQYDGVSPEGTIAFVVEPGEYSPEQRARLRSFLQDGGTLVVAARNPERANPLLADLGADVRVDGAPLRDEREYDRSPDFPVVRTVANHTYVRGSEGTVLNHGTALVVEEGGDARAIADSSAYAYLDRDGDRELDDDEELAARPVVAVQGVGDGEVVAVSDPSAFINAMLDRGANRAFAVALLAEHDRLLLDRTGEGVPPLRWALSAIRGSPLLSGGAGAALVGAVLCWERNVHRRLWDGIRSARGAEPTTVELRADPEAIETYLEARYPDWDEERRKRVVDVIREKRR